MRIRIIFIPLLMILLATSGCKKGIVVSEENKNMGEAHYSMALAEFSEKKMTRALQELIKAYKYDPTNYEITHLLGLVYLSKKLLPNAEKHIKEAITIKKGDFPKARNNLGIVYLEMKRYDDAIEQFTIAAENILYETPEFAYTNLGWAYYKKNEFVKAKEHYQKSINIESRHTLAYYNLALMYSELKKYDEAVSEYKKAIRHFPNYLDAWYSLAKTYYNMDKKAEATEAFKKVIEIVPNDKRAEEAKGYLDLLK